MVPFGEPNYTFTQFGKTDEREDYSDSTFKRLFIWGAKLHIYPIWEKLARGKFTGIVSTKRSTANPRAFPDVGQSY